MERWLFLRNSYCIYIPGNVDIGSGTSTFNNVTINGTLSAGNLTGNADTATDLAINATQNFLSKQVIMQHLHYHLELTITS